MKRLKLLGLAALSLCCISAGEGESKPIIERLEPGVDAFYVDFFNNFNRGEFTLSNGTIGKGNNMIYETKLIKKDELATKPTVDPERRNYEFQGWYKEEECINEWNFTTELVTRHTRLFAKWGVGQEDEGEEPYYVAPSTLLDDSAPTNYVVNSVMNFKITNNQIKVGKAAIDRLMLNADNILPLLEYKVKRHQTITATYNNGNITVTCGSDVQTINVKDDSTSMILDNSNYETKAKNYENKIASENENYHVMLAGSSSIEFWTSSTEDLDPIVSYNHGIGGTTIEQWTEKLNQRLVYPYKPTMVVYYVGINNVINSKQSAATIWNNLEKFFNDTHEALPDTKVQYIMMNLIPGYKGYFDIINEVNAQVVNYQKTNSWLTLINPGTALLKENGEPNAAYFRTDGLHLSYYGYVVWGEIIKQSIMEGLKNN